jgi:ferrochelatase
MSGRNGEIGEGGSASAGAAALPEDLGVVLLNMGGPESLEEIEPFLRRLFSDPMIIAFPLGARLQGMIARRIAARRSRVVRERYARIGGRSPIREETERQAAGLAERLERPVAVAMRYSSPRAMDAVRALRERGVRQLIALPLFPQFSAVTSASSILDLDDARGDEMTMAVVSNHFAEPGFIAAHAAALRGAGGAGPLAEGAHVLFVAHSVPLKIVACGDPYVAQVRETARLIAAACALGAEEWSLAFQSRVGPVRWQGPDIAEALGVLRERGVRRLFVHPVSFVSENLETLYDLDIVFRGQCAEAGIEEFTRIPLPGASPVYLDALAALVRKAAERAAVWSRTKG